MLCKDNMANLDYKSKIYNAKHIFPSFLLFYFLKEIIKTTYHEMHECYAMQILKARRKQINKRRMVTENIEMKHKDYVKKTQLD